MKVRTWTLNRRLWGLMPGDLDNMWSEDGEWHSEPDKVQWIDRRTDLDCLAVRSHSGAWCGYVGVPPGHPCHGVDRKKLPNLEVHGGVNYTAGCDEGAPEEWGICHIPEPGRPADVWWLGFDCGHFGDLKPLMITLVHHAYRSEKLDGLAEAYFRETYRTLAYVRENVGLLAFQLDRLRAEQVAVAV